AKVEAGTEREMASLLTSGEESACHCEMASRSVTREEDPRSSTTGSLSGSDDVLVASTSAVTVPPGLSDAGSRDTRSMLIGVSAGSGRGAAGARPGPAGPRDARSMLMGVSSGSGGGAAGAPTDPAGPAAPAAAPAVAKGLASAGATISRTVSSAASSGRTDGGDNGMVTL